MKTVSSMVAVALVLALASGCVAQPAAPLKVGDAAPDFTLKGSDGQDYQLLQFKGKKAVVVSWFPRAGSQGAKNQCSALTAAMGSIPADKVQVFGCSTAALDVTAAFAQQGQYGFPVLCDFGGATASAYGCLKNDGASERWLVLIDSQGNIAAINKNTTPQTAGTDLTKMLADAGLVTGGTTAGPKPATVDQQITVQAGGQARTCWLHVPAGYDGQKPLPLVIALHGSPGTGTGMIGMTGLSTLADNNGFLVAYPDGIAGTRSWNSLFGKIPGGQGILADDVDDVAFLRALISALEADYHADPARVFVCGHSAGAYMSYRAAVELSDVVAAVGIVNGSLGIKSVDGVPCEATIPPPVAPVSLIHICGRQDVAVKFGGGQTPKNLMRSVPDCIQLFVAANGCATPGTQTDDAATGVKRTVYSGGKQGTEVELVEVQNCGHAWPTAPTGLVASQELWDFFASHPKAAGK